MPDLSRQYHVSSAVVVVLPAMKDAVLAILAGMENVEVYGHEGGKIVVVIEGTSTGMLGEALSTISTLEGVVAANMVFEHVETEFEQVEPEGVTDDDQRTDAA